MAFVRLWEICCMLIQGVTSLTLPLQDVIYIISADALTNRARCSSARRGTNYSLVLNLCVSILLRALDQVQGVPSNATLLQ
jgi:hypothetical protein